jgi:ribose/xylose/arabinose/galactoside ABC-type transport system permease subunit
MPALIGIMILVIGHIVLNHMRFGRYVTAIGANAEGARRSGINTKAVTMKVYIISGMAAALAGMIITRASAAAPPTRAKALNCRSLLPLCSAVPACLAASVPLSARCWARCRLRSFRTG